MIVYVHEVRDRNWPSVRAVVMAGGEVVHRAATVDDALDLVERQAHWELGGVQPELEHFVATTP